MDIMRAQIGQDCNDLSETEILKPKGFQTGSNPAKNTAETMIQRTYLRRTEFEAA